MKNHRIGNDINVKWSIYSNDAPYILEGLDVTLYLKDMFGKKELSGFTVQENNLLWTFAGKDQKHAGKYSLELVINEGKVGMVTVDVCNFVNLVSHSCSTGGKDDVGVETESVDLQSELGTVPIIVDQELNEESGRAIANKAVTAELKKLEVILDGYTPPSQTADVEGDGVGAKTINTLVVPNVEGKMTYKIVALSEINFVSDDDEQHTFVAIANAPTGTNQVNTLAGISTSKGSAESTIAQGSTIVEGVIDTNNLGQFSGTIQDIYIRHRMRGTVQLQYALGESEEGLINAVERLEKEKVGKKELATINGQSLLEGGDIIIQGGGEGGDIVIDASLSETSENAIANKAVTAALKEKQDTLKSGVNIKTINGQSILGEGNITIEGGSGGGSYDDTGIKKDISDLKEKDTEHDTKLAKLSERVGDLEEEKPIFKAIYGVTTYEEIKAAYDSGKVVHCDYNTYCYVLSRINDAGVYFNATNAPNSYRLDCTKANIWSNTVHQMEAKVNKVTSISSSSTDTQYPSAKAVYDALQNVGGGGSGGDDTSLREAIFGKTTSKEFAINGYHAATADTLAVNIAQGEVSHVKLETLGADLKKFQLYVKYEGDSTQTSLLYFSQNRDYSFFAVRPIVELGVNVSSGWVITNGQVRLSITQGGMTSPHNYMDLGEIIMPENASELNVLEYIPHLLRFKNIKVYAHFPYSDSREKKGYISLNSENAVSIALENLFGAVTDTAYIFDILLDSNSITGFIECHSNSFGNPQKSDSNQGKNFGRLTLGNPINEFIIKLPLLAGDKFTFYGK